MKLSTVIAPLTLALALPIHADQDRLAEVLTSQPEATQQRYHYRSPMQTLSFFEVEPGMTVMEALPGGGWYSKILLDYLGSDGQLVGVDYPIDIFSRFSFATPEYIEKKKTWVEDWTNDAEGWRADDDAGVSAFVFGTMPKSAVGSADRFLFIRAMHNLARFEDDGGYLTSALKDAYTALKPGGIMGVVQHEARPDTPDAGAKGNRGYIKKSMVIAAAEKAGFEYVGDSDINQNTRDMPAAEDVVWRLPPNLSTSRDNPVLRLEMISVGESNRMTLKFKKPG